MARRTIRSLAAIVLATAVVGCGGSDDSDLAEATNRTCEDVSAAAKTLSSQLVRGPGNSEMAAVRTAIDRYADAVTAAADELQAAKPTKAERAFQRQAVTQLRAHAEDLRTAAKGNGSRSAAVKRLTATEGAPAPMVPPTVLDAAPACQEAAR